LGYWLDCWFSNQLSNQHPQHPPHHRLKLPPGPLLVHLGPGRNAIQGDVEQHLVAHKGMIWSNRPLLVLFQANLKIQFFKHFSTFHRNLMNKK